MSDVLVIGGGPAGSSTAIRLTQQGMKVRLYEKNRFPRPKLCGGFISPEAIPELDALGVLTDVRSAGAWPVRRVMISSPQGSLAQSDLPGLGLSFSREKLDALLWRRAQEVGVQTFEGQDGFSAPDRAAWTVVATGRKPHPACSHPLPKGEGRVRRYYGLQAVFEDVSGISDQVELDLVPGGYVGLVREDSARVNVCALTTQRTLKTFGPSPDQVLREWVLLNPVLRKHFASARRVTPWQSIGPVVMGIKTLAKESTLYVGDAACVVDPFVGEGIAMCLLGSRRLAEAFAQADRSVPEAYESVWHKDFARSLMIGNFLRATMNSRFLQGVLVSGLQIFPVALRWLTESTRPQVKSLALP